MYLIQILELEILNRAEVPHQSAVALRMAPRSHLANWIGTVRNSSTRDTKVAFVVLFKRR